MQKEPKGVYGEKAFKSIRGLLGQMEDALQQLRGFGLGFERCLTTTTGKRDVKNGEHRSGLCSLSLPSTKTSSALPQLTPQSTPYIAVYDGVRRNRSREAYDLSPPIHTS